MHVVPRDGAWAVKRGGEAASTHATQADAIKAARHMMRDSVAGQFVVLNRNGQIVRHETHGLPTVKEPPRRSRLGTKRIEMAVGSLVLDRMKTDPPPPRA